MVIAREQTRGRGRRERTWDSPADKGLWMSTVIIPSGPEECWTWVPLWAGIAAREAVVDLIQGHTSFEVDRLQLKWPNDLLLDDRKLGGILAERLQNGHGVPAIILGLGINLLQGELDFPAPLRTTAISVAQILLTSLPEGAPEDMLQKVISRFNSLSPLLDPLNPGLISEIWLNHAWGLHTRLRMETENQTVEGTFVGLGQFGEIQLRSEQNRLLQFTHVEKIVRLDG